MFPVFRVIFVSVLGELSILHSVVFGILTHYIGYASANLLVFIFILLIDPR
jgi:hypothetical protein